MDINKITKEWLDSNLNASREEIFMAGFIAHASFLEGVKLKKEDRIKRQKAEFIKELEPYLAVYGRELLNDFYGYWSEADRSRTNIRKNLQKTWETERRLQTWINNNKGFGNKSNGTEPSNKKYKEIT